MTPNMKEWEEMLLTGIRREVFDKCACCVCDRENIRRYDIA